VFTTSSVVASQWSATTIVDASRLAFKSKAVCCAVLTGFSVSDVLSTSHNQTSHLTIQVGVLITGLVSVLFISVLVEDIVGTSTVFILTTQVHFVFKFKSILVSSQVASNIGQVQVAEWFIVNSFTAKEFDIGNFIYSLPQASIIADKLVVVVGILNIFEESIVLLALNQVA
jgi:hypothetical protein